VDRKSTSITVVLDTVTINTHLISAQPVNVLEPVNDWDRYRHQTQTDSTWKHTNHEWMFVKRKENIACRIQGDTVQKLS